jgi:hypothetical protein
VISLIRNSVEAASRPDLTDFFSSCEAFAQFGIETVIPMFQSCQSNSLFPVKMHHK